MPKELKNTTSFRVPEIQEKPQGTGHKKRLQDKTNLTGCLHLLSARSECWVQHQLRSSTPPLARCPVITDRTRMHQHVRYEEQVVYVIIKLSWRNTHVLQTSEPQRSNIHAGTRAPSEQSPSSEMTWKASLQVPQGVIQSGSHKTDGYQARQPTKHITSNRIEHSRLLGCDTASISKCRTFQRSCVTKSRKIIWVGHVKRMG